MTAVTALKTPKEVTTNPFLFDVMAGLNAEQKQLSPKYFYDEKGSRYFDDICSLNEYYPYRTELNLLDTIARDMSTLVKEAVTVVEFGAGSLRKIQPLLQNMPNIETFIPIDISGEHLHSAAERLAEMFPSLQIVPKQGDFTEVMSLPKSTTNYLGFFPGSTIGNFNPAEALQFLQNARATLRENGRLLIGVDTKKSPEVLHRAYNDSKGVTAKFNLNILHRINNELDGDIDIEQFEHYAFYNPELGCIQMHLISKCEQACSINGQEVSFACGESIHTENSFKYSPEEFQQLAKTAGWTTEKVWLAPDNMFSTFLLRSQ